MQFLKITDSTTLSDLRDTVGNSNVESVLNLNGLERTPDVGKQLSDKIDSIKSSENTVNTQKKISILNSMMTDSDVFEYAALQSESDWNVLATTGTFTSMLKMPDSVSLPDTASTMGNNTPVSSSTYSSVMSALNNSSTISGSAFNDYSSSTNVSMSDYGSTSGMDFTSCFKLPWGKITLYSSISGSSMDFPCYPEEIDDGTSASYTTIGDILYQYEPWYVFTGSGPRSITFSFSIHRDMFTGDHFDGKCNELLRFVESNCYAEYNGAAVNTATVGMYIDGSAMITGIMTDYKVKWSGPIGADGFYLCCDLSFTITEVSSTALNYGVIQSKGLIG